MDEFRRLSLALRQSLEHLPLLGVLVLEFASLFIVSFLFSLAGFAFQRMQGVIVALMIAQLVALIAGDAFFKAGLSGMARDVVREEPSGIRGFLPSARGYWSRFFAYLFARAALCVAALVPFLVVTALSPAQGLSVAQGVLLIAGIVLIALIALFWLLWTEAVIVWEGLGPLAAMGRSARLAHARASLTLRAMLVCALILLAALALGLLVNVPYQAAFAPNPAAEPSAPALALGAALDIVTSVVFAYALVVLTLFVFGTYEGMQGAGRSGVVAAADAVRKKAARRK